MPQIMTDTPTTEKITDPCKSGGDWRRCCWRSILFHLPTGWKDVVLVERDELTSETVGMPQARSIPFHLIKY